MGIHVAEHAVSGALGRCEANEHPLGLWIGSSENKAVCTSLLQDLIARDGQATLTWSGLHGAEGAPS
jgi:hypothetical protein